MKFTFLKYFFKYIFFSKTRQKLIFLAICGLLISSFSLVVIQGIMGGLQKGLVSRSKNVLGTGFIQTKNLSITSEEYKSLITTLVKNNITSIPELEIELLVQNEKFVSPVILHGLDMSYSKPKFLKSRDFDELILGSDLGRDLRAFFGSKIIVTSPSHTDFIFNEIPRQSITEVSDFFSSELPEIDKLHGWIRLSFMQNLIRKHEINKIRIYDKDIEYVSNILSSSKLDYRVVSWEEQNSSLVWALNLETRVMLFLFIGMSFLIAICITSGFLIFFNKIKIDLSSFWILGMSKDQLSRLSYIFGQSITIIFSLLGLCLGLLFLYLLDSKLLVIMPDLFIERNIPVSLTISQIIISFFVPYVISSIFTHFTFKSFINESKSFLSLIRKVG